jgi:TM2 domain-containing membrane protein YozV
VSAALACPYCRMPLDEADGQATMCPGCGTPHHSDCFEENGGCTVFGCSAAPPPEPKVSIGAPELTAVQEFQAAQPAPRAAPPPPPPSPGIPAVPPARPLFSSTGYSPPQFLPSLAAGLSPVTGAATFQSTVPSDKHRTTFVVLGILLGAFGAHSFYVGSTKKAILQLALTLFTLGFGGFMVWLWAIIDVCTITTDHNGLPLRS